MCPSGSTPTVVTDVDAPVEYFTWLTTARCVISFIYQHHTDKSKLLCHNCNYRITLSERMLYTPKIRHYIFIGSPYEFEKCAICCISLANPRRTNECNVCRHELIHFLNFLQVMGETPYLNNEPTIVHITQINL
jgi:hypothetical protein